MITLCGSTYAKFVCSIILKQPSYILMCSSFIAFKLQAHSILESKFSFILFFFFTILIIPHHPSFFKIKATKKSTFTVDLSMFSSGATILLNGATKQNRTADLRVTNPLLYQLSYSGILNVQDKFYRIFHVMSIPPVQYFYFYYLSDTSSGIFSYKGMIKFNAVSTVLEAS